MSVFLYVLREHGDDEVRYVGITDDPPRRLQQHTGPYSPSMTWRWSQGRDVAMDVLAAFDTRDDAALAEIDEIARRRAAGERLLNVHAGGTGGRLTPETAAKIAATLSGRRLSDEHRAHLAEAARARTAPTVHLPWTDEQRAAFRATLAARSPEERARISANIAAAKRGRPRPDVSERNRRRAWDQR